ncbi:MAG TPA: hypothetical protein VFF33_04180 [Ignavibacteriaceae bacterium]|nr:hypothetical protein [Ignavibacteriaceae bacterium]
MKKVLFLLLLSSSFIYSQDYRGFASEIFFGRQPSAKAEAMGKGLIASEDGANSSFYNPASIGFTKGVNFNYSYGNPYYAYVNASYNYMGLSVKLAKNHTLSINRFAFNFGNKFSLPQYNILYNIMEDVNDQLYKINYAFNPSEDLAIGLNINYFRNSYYNKITSEKLAILDNYMLDLGALKIFELNETDEYKNSINAGLVVKNLFRADVEYDGIQSEMLPSSIEGGIAYVSSNYSNQWVKGLNNLDFLFNVEYRYVLKSERYTTFSTGVEIKALEIFALRFGYYIEKAGLGNNGKDNLTDFTYGLGLSVPFQKLYNYPFELRLDYVGKKQPSYVTDYDDWDNLNVFSTSFNWIF